MQRLVLAAVVLVTLAGGAARADSDAAEVVAKKMLDVQVAALRMHDVRTLITTFGDEGFLIGPSDVAGPNHSYLFTGAIAAILSRPSVGVLADVTVTSYHAGGNGDDLVWLAAELVASYQGEDRSVRSVPLRVSESLFKTKEAWRVSMAHVAVPTTDLSPRAMPLMQLNEYNDPGLDYLRRDLTSAIRLDRLLATGAPIVLGTEPREQAYGEAAGHELLRQWRNLAMSITGRPRENAAGEGAEWVVANIDLKRAGSGVPARMRASFVLEPQHNTTAFVLVHFSVAAD